jgi:uncharacterized membrane protein YkvA (DUF1232 family)
LQALSYVDREKILAIRERVVQSGQSRSDEQIAREVSHALQAHAGRTGFEYCFTRYALELTYDLLYTDDRSVRETARGALLYFLEQNDFIDDLGDASGLEDDYYVLSLAMHEIETRTGEPPSYSGPILIEEHHESIIHSLCEYAGRPLHSDRVLIDESMRLVSMLQPIAMSGFFGRFVRSIERLAILLETGNDLGRV